MVLFRLFLGIALLVMGSRLFWLFLGGVGFVFAFDLAERMIHGEPHSVIFIIALFAGVLGAMVAVFLQKYAVLAGGFFAGSYLLIELLTALGVRIGDYHWLVFIAGGLAGAVLMTVVFGWALIIISSLMGSILILQTFHFGHQLSEVVFICFAILGIVIQSGSARKKSPA
ncbi:MAG: hypothetical protein ACLPN1_02310 [Dissulfurispiraceae bacterium]|jgi:hypothetical protein